MIRIASISKLISSVGQQAAYSVGGQGARWRECDWDPTVSEFAARILLGRVRMVPTDALKAQANRH